MYSCRAVCNVIPKQRIGLYNGIQVINRGCKHSGLLPPCIKNKGYSNKFIFVESNFEPVKKTLNFSMNFSTTAGVRSSRQGSNQDKEKLKNYIVFGGLLGFASLVFLTNLIIQNTHHDHVYIQAPRENK